MTRMTILLLAFALGAGPNASGHAGRRFTIEVVNNKIQAQGINSGPSDGAPAFRPYLNSLHDHFRNIDAAQAAIANLPGYDFPAFTLPLVGKRLELKWTGTRKWLNPPLEPAANTQPTFHPLDDGERINIFGPFSDANSDQPSPLVLAEDLPATGATDVDLVYQINAIPQNVLYLLRFEMVALQVDGMPSDVIGSDPIYVTLAPDGDTPEERLQLASIFLESYVANVPEPSGVLQLPMLLFFVVTLRQRFLRTRRQS